jgi:hypothetical protein
MHNIIYVNHTKKTFKGDFTASQGGNVLVSDQKGLDQPACQERWRKCKKKGRKKNSKANDVQYICMSMCVIYVVVLFTCTSHPDSNEGDKCDTRSIWDKQQDTEWGVTTRNAHGVEGQKEAQSKPGWRP